MPASIVAQVVNLHRAQLRGVIELGGVRKVRGLYESIRAELEADLESLVRKGQGQSFSAYHLRAVLLQVKDGLRSFQKGFAPELANAGEATATLAQRHVVGAVKAFEKRFAGTEPVLRLEEASVFRGIYRGVEPSLLMRYHKLASNYPLPTIQRVQNQLALSMIRNEGVGDAVRRIAAKGGVFDRERWRAERIVRTECLLGDALVDSAVVGAVHRRPYDGPVVEIITSRGRKLTATPNHPMLTRRGWVVAGEITESDHLICNTRKQNAGTSSYKDVAAPPTKISEIFDAASAVGIRERVHGGKPDFHGDGMQGQIDIANPSRMLRIGEFAAIYKPLANQIFSVSDLGDATFCSRCQRLLSLQRQPCLCSVSHANSHLEQSFTNRRPGNIETLSYFNSALASLVSLAEKFIVDVMPVLPALATVGVEVPQGFGWGPGNAGVRQDAMDRAQREMDPLGDIMGAGPSEIEFDHILAVSIRRFCGHVFNLSTPYGYFTMNGVYTGNSSYAYGVTNQQCLHEVAHEVPQLMKRLVATKDAREGEDSKQLDGQTVKYDEPFTWRKRLRGGGEELVRYMQPP